MFPREEAQRLFVQRKFAKILLLWVQKLITGAVPLKG